MTKKKHFITLGNGRRVSVGEYVRAWRAVLADKSGANYSHGLCGWWHVSPHDVLAEFRRGLHDRINKHLPWYGQGRKWSDEWQADTWRAARDLNTPRLVIRWLPAWLKKRFQHRITTD